MAWPLIPACTCCAAGHPPPTGIVPDSTSPVGPSFVMHHSELSFNLCHVFDELVRVGASSTDTNSNTNSHASPATRKRTALTPNDPSSSSPALTTAHLRHVFSFLKLQLSEHELEEILSLLDDNGDGKVTMYDFMHALTLTPHSAFDPRSAVNLPFQALDDAAKKDNLITDDDLRAARDALGPLFSVANDSEINLTVRALQHAGAQHERAIAMGRSVHRDDSSMSVEPPSPLHANGRRLQRGVDKESFRRVVSALVLDGPPPPPLSSSASRSSAHSSSYAPTPVHHTPALTPAQLHPAAYLDEAPSNLSIGVGLSASGAPLPPTLQLPSLSESDLELHSPSEAAPPLLPHPPHTARPSMPRKHSAPVGSQTSTHRIAMMRKASYLPPTPASGRTRA